MVGVDRLVVVGVDTVVVVGVDTVDDVDDTEMEVLDVDKLQGKRMIVVSLNTKATLHLAPG